MNRRFIINLIFAVGINLLIKPFWVLGVERGVQNAIGPEAYGFYFSLFSFSFLFNVVLDFGINNYNNTFISKYPQLLSKKFAQLVMLKLMLLVVYLVVTILAAFLVGYDAIQFKLLMVLCFNQILSFAITYLRTNISGLQFFITDSILSVLDRLLMILFCALLLWGKVFGELQLNWFVYSQTLSYSITLIICFFVLKPHLISLKWKWNKAFTIHLLKKSYPYAVLGILMGVYTKIDGVLIERLLPQGKMAAGHYASAYRLLDAANMIAVLFAGLLLPIFSRLLQQKESPKSLLQLSFTLIITPALLAVSVCYFYQHEIILMLNKSGNPEIEKVLYILMASFVFTCTVYIYGTYLTAKGELKILNRVALFACILNIVLNMFLIPLWGIIGAAISSLITQAVVAISHYGIVHYQDKNKLEKSLVIKLIVFALLQIIAPYLLLSIDCHFIVKIFLQMGFGILALIYSNVIGMQHLKKLIVRP